MITITHEGNGYKIKLSWPGTGTRGYNVHANDVNEIHAALDHYYMHNDHYKIEPADNCLLCRSGRHKRGGC